MTEGKENQNLNNEQKDQMKKSLTNKDINKSWFLWWLLAETNHSFERMEGVSYALALQPALKKLYKKKEDLKAALKRHTQFFNTNSIWGSIIPGISLAMEQEKAEGKEIPDEAIVGTKTGLMGPLAGIGDTIDWGMWLPIILSLFIPMAKSGSGWAGVLPFIIFLAITLIESYFLFHLGYNSGLQSVNRILKGGAVQKLITGASVLGLFMMGGLASSYVNVHTPLKITAGAKVISVQTQILNAIAPGLLPLAVVVGIYLYLTKVDHNYTRAMLLVILVALVLGGFGILK